MQIHENTVLLVNSSISKLCSYVFTLDSDWCQHDDMAATTGTPTVQGGKNREKSRSDRALILVQLVNLDNVTAP
jgi:hypothetical protein